MTCNCGIGNAYAAADHMTTCPRFAHQCDWCDGKGHTIVSPCGDYSCCTEPERCDECNGTGNTPSPPTPRDAP